jgi:hypothetical protein
MSAVDGFVPRIGGCLLSTVSSGINKLEKRVKAQDTSAESKPDLPLEIAHLLLIDVVGYSKLLPFWDRLRGDPRFEKIVASLAPKELLSLVAVCKRTTAFDSSLL